MSNDTVLSTNIGTGDRVRDFDDGTRKWPCSFLAFGVVSDPGPIASPTVVSATNPLPVTNLQLPVALGQTTMASALSVAVASNQTAIPVSGTVTANAGTGTQAVSIAATQAVNLAQVGAAAVALGQATMASSLPVVVASNQTAIPVSGTVTANAGTGTLAVSLAANQTTVQNPQTSGGLSIYRVLWPGNATGVTIKTSAGQLYGGYIFNVATTVRFVKLYNKATAPSVGTDTPAMTLCLPAGGGATFNWDKGVAFGTGIGIGVTTLVGDSDTTAPSANDVTINLFYF